MMRSFILLGTCVLSVCFSSFESLAQREVMPRIVRARMIRSAEADQRAQRYSEAHDKYRSVAHAIQAEARRDSAFAWALTDSTLAVYQQGVVCAMEVGNTRAASDLLDSLIALNRISPAQWLTRMELAQIADNSQELNALLEEGKAKFDGTNWNDQADALVASFEDVEHALTPATLRAFRPSSVAPEFGAVPYGDGVVFVASGEVPGLSPIVDGWTGYTFTELRWEDDRNNADGSPDFFEMVLRKDLLKADRGVYNEGPVAFSEDGQRAFLTRSQRSWLDPSGHAVQNLELILLEREGKRWVVSPHPFPFNEPQFSTCHGVLDPSGHLIFASDRPGGQGGMDLWKCEALASGGWGEPKNLGSKINTAGHEIFPFVNSVNQLYFSSDGQPNRYGGLDVYKHDFASSQTVLLGDPINSFADDFAMVVDGTGAGYLSSNREGGMDRIYSLAMLEVLADFEVQFVACDELTSSGIRVQILNKATMEAETLETDEDGKVTFQARVGEAVELAFGGDWTYQGIEPREFMSPVEGLSQHEIRLEYTPRENQVRVATAQANSREVEFQLTHSNGSVVPLATNDEGVARWGLQEYANYEKVQANAVGFQTQVELIRNQENCPRPDSITVTMDRVVDIDLSLIFYDLNKATLRERSKMVLDSVVVYMNAVQNVNLELSAHTDCRGSDEHNAELSQARAQSCVDYIVAAGISKDRIIPRGYGERCLKNECADGVSCTEAQHQENRRTELRIIPEGTTTARPCE